MGNSLITYFFQSNFAGQCILVALGVFSLVAWTVMVGKYLELGRLAGLNRHFEKKLLNSTSVLGLNLSKQTGVAGPYVTLVRESIRTYFQVKGQVGGARGARLIVMGQIENTLQREVAKHTLVYEAKMVMLQSIVSGAPFLGLLGTVWGVMDAFGAMALQSSASIQHLAPGVSGALLTTVAGLLVAIPSVFGYNFLLNKSRQLITHIENFASAVADRVEVELVMEEENRVHQEMSVGAK